MKAFTETQKMPLAFYIIMVIGLIIPVMLLLYLYTQAVSEAKKNELMLVAFIVLLSEAIAFWLIRAMQQQVEINKSGIYYRYPPFKRKKVFIAMKAIESYTLQDYNFPNYGYKAGAWNILKTTPSITTMGLKKVLRVQYDKGKVILIGTQRPKEILETLCYYKSKENELF